MIFYRKGLRSVDKKGKGKWIGPDEENRASYVSRY
jgi:hypothetical protein